MLRVYAAWTHGATEADLVAIEKALITTPRRGFTTEWERFPPQEMPRQWALDWPLQDPAKAASVGTLTRYLAEREGFEPSKGF